MDRSLQAKFNKLNTSSGFCAIIVNGTVREAEETRSGVSGMNNYNYI